jgi:multicomponent Na+:H+ antiporter subunit D
VTPPLAQALPPLCVAIPLMAAAVLAPLHKRLPGWASSLVTTLVTAVTIAVSFALATYTADNGPIVHWFGGWLPIGNLAIGIAFSVDTISAGLSAFIACLVLAAVAYTWQKFEVEGTLFHSLLLAFLGSMCGYALTGDLFNMFVWFELMTAAAIALTAYKIEEAESIEGGINLAVINSIGGFIVLLGIGLIYARTDALNLAQLGQVLARGGADPLVVLAFALIVCGYFVKGSVAPFHFWLDDAHAVAPTPVCILFSGIMVQLALYGVARVYWTVFAAPLGSHAHAIASLFIGLGIATALTGGIMAFAQRHLKRLLAFSTVSHSGMFVAAMGLFGAAGASACATFIVAHGLVKSALFVCAGNYLNRFRSLDEQVLGGKGRATALNSALFILGGLALAGLPPFGISVAKTIYDAALKESNLFWLAIVMAFASALDAGAVVRAGLHVTFGIGKGQITGFSPHEEEPECEGERLERTPWPMYAVPLCLLGGAVWIGTVPYFSIAADRAAHAFVDRGYYVAAVLHGVHRALPAAFPQWPTGEDLKVDFAVVAAAIAAAFLGLYRDHIPQHLAPVLGPPLRFLRNLHSGIFTDYVAYLMFGIAGYATYLLVAIH